MQDPATRIALIRYVTRALGTVALGVGGLILAVVLLAVFNYPDSGPANLAIIAVVAFSLIAVVGGLLAAANSVRMWIRLRRHPWAYWPARYREVWWIPFFRSPNGTPTLVLGNEDEHVLVPVAWRWRWHHVAQVDQVIVAGDPRRNGVIAPAAGGPLLWSHAPRVWASRLRRIALDSE